MSRMKLERLRRQWSQQELAVIAHVGVADVSRIETLRMRPYPGQSEKLAWALRLRPEELQEEVTADEAAAVLNRDDAFSIGLRSRGKRDKFTLGGGKK